MTELKNLKSYCDVIIKPKDEFDYLKGIRKLAAKLLGTNPDLIRIDCDSDGTLIATAVVPITDIKIKFSFNLDSEKTK
jgi:hypothetical protein